MSSRLKRKVVEVYRNSSDEDDVIAHSRMVTTSNNGRRHWSHPSSPVKWSKDPAPTTPTTIIYDETSNVDAEINFDQFLHAANEAFDKDSSTSKQNAKRYQTSNAKRYQTSDAPLLEWAGKSGEMGYRDEFLMEELLLEARGESGDQPCTCGKGPFSGGNERLYRCNDCFGMEVVCHDCCVERHRHLPLHNIKKWNGAFLERVYLKDDLGLQVQLGHEDCCCTERGHVKFLVIDVSGIHPVNVNFCGCENRVSHRQQLLRAGWYPMTVHNPRTACTKQVLEHFLRLTWSSKVSAYEYYRAIELLTDNTRINLPPNRYVGFLRAIRQTRHLKMMKHGGRGNMSGGVKATQIGELAVICPACPHPGINLPEGWRNAEPSRKFLYFLLLAIDANFRLKNRHRSSDIADPGLHAGLAYFVPQTQYKAHILKNANQKDISTCSGFKSMAHAETKFATGLRSTGVGLCICSRHEFIRPNGVGDLQKGERFCNMDYIFFSSLVPLLLLSVVVSYDIACQWKVNLLKRMVELPREIQLPLTVATSCFMFGIPKFHAPAHAAACATPHSLNLMPGVARTDGEGVERTWSELNHVANSTKEMGPGSRHDTIDCQIGHHNWQKYTGMGESLRRRLVVAYAEARRHATALEEFKVAVDLEHREAWTKMVEAWEADKSQPNPYLVEKKFASEADVRAELAAEDETAAASGRLGRHDISPGSFVTLGLFLEESQRRLKSEVKEKSSNTVAQVTELKNRRATLYRQIHRFRAIQPIYMVGLESHISHSDPATTEPEGIVLLLPSAVEPGARQDICNSDVASIEEKLRESQCHDALHKLRSYLHTRTHFIKYRNTNVRGQRANTRAFGLIDRVSKKINHASIKYRVARAALLSLRSPGSWEDELRVLQESDIVAAPASGDLDKSLDPFGPDGRRRQPQELELLSRGLGEGRRTLSWIWKTSGALGDNERLNEVLRTEWLKSRARAARWAEEVMLLTEEMRRVLEYMEWKARWWHMKREVEGAGKYNEGICAYANRQAAMHRKLRAHFLALWAGHLSDGSQQVAGMGVEYASRDDAEGGYDTNEGGYDASEEDED